MQITSAVVFSLAGTAGCDVKSARRWLDPTQRERMRPMTRQRIERAARELGIVTSRPLAITRNQGQIA